MLYCSRCKIYIEDDRSHCPLCGKCVSEDNIKTPRRHDYYPDYHRWRRDRINLALLFTLILTGLNIAWLIIEWYIFDEIYYAWIFIPASLPVFTFFIWPVSKISSLSTKNVFSAVLLCAFIYFAECYTKSAGWGIGIVIPVLLAINSLVLFCVMMVRGYYKRSKMIPCLFIALLCTASLCIFLLSSYPDYATVWVNIVCLILCWTFTFLLFGVRYKKVVDGLKKDFHF